MLLLLLVFLSCLVRAQDMPLQINIEAAEHEKIRVLVCLVQDDQTSKEVAQVVKHDLMFSGQFDVEIKTCAKIPENKKESQQFFDHGYLFALFLTKKDTHYSWYLCDTGSGTIKHASVQKSFATSRALAHHIADHVWPVLTGQAGCFSTQIAFCKQVPGKKGQHYKHIYVAEYDGSNPRPLITTPTVNVAPAWNRDAQHPLLFYSESTSKNIRLMVTDLQGKRKIASNNDGLTMLPTFSADGKKVVYCASHGKGSCQLYAYNQGKSTQLTQEKANAVSPSLSDDGTVLYYCSDKAGTPQIYRRDLSSGQELQITTGSPAYCPSYSPVRQMLVYTKSVSGTAQLHLYDEISKEHTQLTFDPGHKEECSWSSCGNYIIFGYQKGGTERIALLNLMTNERHFLTAANEKCSYPAPSPVYA